MPWITRSEIKLIFKLDYWFPMAIIFRAGYKGRESYVKYKMMYRAACCLAAT